MTHLKGISQNYLTSAKTWSSQPIDWHWYNKQNLTQKPKQGLQNNYHILAKLNAMILKCGLDAL